MRNAAAASSAMPSLAPMAIFAATVCFVAACLTAISISVAYITPLRDLPSDGARICTTDLTCPSYQRLTYDGNCASCVDTLPISAVGGQNALTPFIPASFRFEDLTSVRLIYETGWTAPDVSGIVYSFTTGVSGFHVTYALVQQKFFKGVNNSIENAFGAGTWDIVKTEMHFGGSGTFTNGTEAPIVIVADISSMGIWASSYMWTFGAGVVVMPGGFSPVGGVEIVDFNDPTPIGMTINMKPTQSVNGASSFAAQITVFQVGAAA